MGELDIQIKVLKQGTPVLFTWLNEDTRMIEGYVVTCPCQNLGVIDDSSSVTPKKTGTSHQLPNLHNEISPMSLAKVLQVAEIVTISKGAEMRSALGVDSPCELTCGRVEREIGIGKNEDVEKSAVDEYRVSEGGLGGLEECMEGVGEGLHAEGDINGEDVGSMVLSDDSDVETDQIDGGDGEQDSGREKANRSLNVVEENTDFSEMNGNNVTESIGVFGSGNESRNRFAWTGDVRQIREGEVKIKDEESLKLTLSDIQEDRGDHLEDNGIKDISHGENKRDSVAIMAEDKSAVEQTDIGAQDETEGIHLRDGSCVSKQGVQDSVTDSVLTASSNVEVGGAMDTKGGEDDMETEESRVSENVIVIHNSENVLEVNNTHQEQQSNVVTQVIDVSNISADSVMILDESKGPLSEVDSAIYKALKGIMGVPLAGDTTCRAVSSGQRHSELIQTSPEVSSVVCSEPLLTPDPVCVINTPAMMKYREHKNEEYLKRLRKLHCNDGAVGSICEFCGAILKSKNLANHISGFHAEDTRERRYRCELCGNAYLRHENLQRHMTSHTGAKFSCERCGKNFRHEYSLKAHEKTHWETPPPLPVRKPKYRTLSPRTRMPRDRTQLLATQQQKNPIARRSKQVSCQICGKTVSSKSLCRHLRIIHKVVSQNGRSGTKQPSTKTCDTCGKTVSRKSIKRHLRLHTETEPKREMGQVVCEICGKTLKKSSMKTHLETHNPKMSKCEICGKVVRNGSKYGHAKLHTDKREHACTYCDLRFHFRSSLIAHIRKHTKERPIPCRYCELTFPRYEARNIHERLHTGERPYKCDICQKDWRDRATYSHHMQKHHPGIPMQMKRWPPPAPSSIQSNIQQDVM